jgi:VanZ family protein
MRLVKLWLPVLVWSAIILSAANDSFSAGETRSWLDRLFGRELPQFVNVAFRKGGHVVAYAILGALAWRADRRLPVVFSVVLLVAVTDEYRQGLTRMRQGSAGDVLLDAFGAALAVWALTRWTRKRQE